MSMADERLILIPGMGADERLFGPQRGAGFQFEVPRLPVPGPDDDMAAYAERVRDDLRLDGPCVLGGVSFGGMLAYQMATVCPARCVVSIGSCTSRSALRWWHFAVGWVGRLLPNALVRGRCVASSRVMARLESLDVDQTRLIRDMSRDVEVAYLRGVGRMILGWRAPEALPCPVHVIHGEVDRIIPVAGVDPDEVVPGGGHLINLTHAEQINRFLRRHLTEGTAAGDRPGRPEPATSDRPGV